MSNCYRGPSIDAFYQVSVHLAKRFQRRRFFFKLTNQKQELPVVAMFLNGSERNVQSLQRTFHICILPSFSSFDQVVSEKIFQKSINQKQELPVVAMFINGSGQDVQSLQRPRNRCFLLSFGSFGQAVSEEKNFQEKKQSVKELPLAAMFVNRSRRNVPFPQRTFHRCFLLSFGSIGQAVTEEKNF